MKLKYFDFFLSSHMWKDMQYMMWHIQLDKMPHYTRKRRESEWMHYRHRLFALWVVLSFFSLSLFLPPSPFSCSLCTITMSKVILSNWHEVKEKEKDDFNWSELMEQSYNYKPSHHTHTRMNFSISLAFVWRKANIHFEERKKKDFFLWNYANTHTYFVLKRVQEKEVIYNHHNQVYI